VERSDTISIFEGFLKAVLSLTCSEYGYIGEILHTDEGQPYMKTFAITNISWDDATRQFYQDNAPTGLEFYNLKTLFGQVMVAGEAVIANDPKTDPRSGGLPQGHPPLNAFLGVPIISRREMVGMVGLANCPGGYSEGDVEFLSPLLLTCGNYIRMMREEQSRRIIENSLTEVELRAEAALNSSLDAIITINDQGIVESANKALQKIFGYQSGEVVGQNVKILMPEPHRSHHDEYIQRYLKTGETKIIGIGREATAQRKDGTRFPIELAVTEFSIPGKHLFTGVIKDISKRKLAEARLEETLRELETSRANMLAILGEVRTGVLMLDESGQIEFVNNALEILVQKGHESLIGQHWETALPLHQQQKQNIRTQLGQTFESRSPTMVKFFSARGQDAWGEIEVCDDPRNPLWKLLFVYNVTEVNRLRAQLSAGIRRQIIGRSPKMQEMFNVLNKLAQGDWTVLIEGETGVGKELVAQWIHAASPRREGPFIAVNCGGLTESLLTSQLFGCRRGAFTGAVADQEGLFEAAHGGTIFLDEIGDVPMDVQTAMLRVLQEREITRIGETKPRKIDVRVLSATNRDLTQEVAMGRFRQDLLYRIRVARVNVPPLRERRDDIPPLVTAFLKDIKIQTSNNIQGVADSAMQVLMSYDWPGNVRELRNAIETAAINSESDFVQTQDLPPEILYAAISPATQPSAPTVPPVQFEATLQDTRTEIEDALKRARGNRSKAAKLLGISRATLYRRLDEEGLDTRKKK
jgi:PAS domain S-box-containing protein